MKEILATITLPFIDQYLARNTRPQVFPIHIFIMYVDEKNTRKGNKNSSLPSSQTGIGKSASNSGTNSKGLAQNENTFANSCTVETTETAPVSEFSHCGENLQRIEVVDHERRTRIDIVFEKRVEHGDAWIKHCPADLRDPSSMGLESKPTF